MSLPHLRFREPHGVEMAFWDMADERGAFFAYGGPVNYWGQVKDCTGRERDLNWYAARTLAALPPQNWQSIQAVIVMVLRHEGPYAAIQACKRIDRGVE